jgi:hypothetical protein
MLRGLLKDTIKEIKHFKSLNSIFMFNYYKIIETDDLRYLLKLDDYEDLPDISTDHLDDVWEGLKLDVQEENVRLHRKSEIISDKAQQIRIKTADYTLIQQLIGFLWHVKNEEHRETLEKLGYKIDDKRDWHQELNRIKKRSQIKLTEIGILNADLDDLTKVSDGSKSTIYDEKRSIEKVLDTKINIKKTVMSEWLVMKFEAIKISESQKNKK